MNNIVTGLEYSGMYGDRVGWEMRGVGFFPDSSMVGKDISGFFAPDKVVIKCKHCGQWGARFCECRKCGAPIE